MLRVIKGHKIWIELDRARLEKGEVAAGNIYWGHAMQPDGLPGGGKIKGALFTPGGEKFSLPLSPEGKGLRWRWRPEREGLWAVVAENEVGVLVLTRDGLYKPGTRADYPDACEAAYYRQYAKAYFQVAPFCLVCGDLERQSDLSFLGQELEMVAAPDFYRPGREIVLTVFYRGLPLPYAPVLATFGGCSHPSWAYRRATDGRGRVSFPLGREGRWLFYVRHVDPERGEPGLYEHRVLDATFCLDI
ncbi:DUF4198 domain-containing protein [Ammonifex thiophilus]|nr:DUF4198 domain-containing protein [Ammonifex thiophilus]